MTEKKVLTLAKLKEDLDRCLTQEELAAMGIRSAVSLQRDRWAHQGIPYIKLGRHPVYRAGDVLAWVEKQRVSTSGVAA